jgi:hypothetical protein
MLDVFAAHGVSFPVSHGGPIQGRHSRGGSAALGRGDGLTGKGFGFVEGLTVF